MPETFLSEVELGRVCLWTADLPQLVDYHSALEADIDDLLSRGARNTRAAGEQTSNTLQQCEGPHWRRFFGEVQKALERLLRSSPAVLDESTVHIRAWAHRLTAEEPPGSEFYLSALHNHSPAFLSGVYYLRVPEVPPSSAQGGTYFVNPFPHSLVSPSAGVVVTASVARLVLFPSWVLHSAFLPQVGAWGSTRLVIAFDAHLLPR